MINKNCQLIDCENWDTGCSVCCCHLTSNGDYYCRSYITPEQYKKRMGEKFPKKGMVWTRTHGTLNPIWQIWKVLPFDEALYEKKEALEDRRDCQILCILPPLPPDNN